MRVSRRQQGFSLVELVVAISIMGILSIGVVSFITTSATGYMQTAARNQLGSAGRTAIERVTLEVRDALPNSIRVSGVSGAGSQCLEFVPVISGTRYLNPAFRPDDPVTEFDVVTFGTDIAGLSGLDAIIYPHATDVVYAGGARVSVGMISDLGGGIYRLETGAHSFPRRSPRERLFLVDGPVSFCVDGDSLYRYSGYGFQAAQPGLSALPGSTGAGRHLISDSIDNTGLTPFRYLNPNRRRNGMLQMQLNFSDDGESVMLNHEVMLQNVP